MLKLSRSMSIIASALLLFGVGPASARSGGDCWQTSLMHLRASSFDGYSIYRRVSDPSFFKSLIRCDDAQFDLSTAVHESTHLITGEDDAFPLIGGGRMPLPHEISGFYPPTRIAKRFTSDDFTTVYLQLGKASSSTDFLFLLDELNAYTHDLNTAIDLKGLETEDRDVDHRDGLAALMAYVAVYVERAKESEPATWQGLQEPQVASTVATLWRQSERVMTASCGIPHFGTLDKSYIRRFCAAREQAALGQIIGGVPVWPMACLEPASEVAEAGGTDADEAEARPHRSTAGPSWLRKVIASKRAAIGAEPLDETPTGTAR